MSRMVAETPIQTERAYALTIAGLDPCAGAGILADIKVFEASMVYGLGVCTALTMQHDADFRQVRWVALPTIIDQCKPLVERYPIRAVKIGLIESLFVLTELLDWLTVQLPGVPLLWDPILSASAGFRFHGSTGWDSLRNILPRLALLTPNVPEVRQLASGKEAQLAAEELSHYCPVYLKGGHAEPREGTVTDYLLMDGKVVVSYPAAFVPNGNKHGSGCVLSAAMAAALAGNSSLPDACLSARRYMSQYLASSPTLLGFHQPYS
jgi:hydroxymethylpyrimidine/phosphomethylpyrimidine kinase